MKELKNTKNKYFTMIPNLMMEELNAHELALYTHIKRHAGEDGKCFVTQKTLMEKLSIGKKAFDKALHVLLEKEFIKYYGKTNGKTRPINTYRVCDIWSLNIKHFEKISTESNISDDYYFGDLFPLPKEKSPKPSKLSSKSNVEEEPYLIKTNEEDGGTFSENKENIQKIIDKINESFGRNRNIIQGNNNDP